jgi:hypothetical protein
MYSFVPVSLPVAGLGAGTLCVCVALVSTAGQRVPDVSRLAATDWPVIRTHLKHRPFSSTSVM